MEHGRKLSLPLSPDAKEFRPFETGAISSEIFKIVQFTTQISSIHESIRDSKDKIRRELYKEGDSEALILAELLDDIQNIQNVPSLIRLLRRRESDRTAVYCQQN